MISLQSQLNSAIELAKKKLTLIVKFTKRQDCQQVWNVEKDVHRMKMEDVNLPGQNKPFINRSLFAILQSSMVQEQKAT